MRVILGCLAVLLGWCETTAGDSPFPLVVRDSGHRADHYCGLYCVFQAGRLADRPVDLDRLVRSDRLTGQFGSTAADLLACCDEFGIDCMYVPNTSYLDVCLLDRPAIVLIRSSPEFPTPNHWVLILTAGLGVAEVYEPSVGVLQLTAAELQSLWGGPAIVLVNRADDPGVRFGWTAAKAVILVGMVCLTLLLLRVFARVRLSPLAGLLGTALVLAGAAHFLHPAGFPHNPAVIADLCAAHRPRQPGWVTAEELLSSPVMVIDAREPDQFEHARIPGAMNVPISGSYFRNRKVLAAVPRDAHVVLYCNSADCPWSETLASSPLFREFASVSVLDGGLLAYKAAGGQVVRGRLSPDKGE